MVNLVPNPPPPRQVILHYFTDPSVKMGRAAGDEHSQTSKGHLINREPFQKAILPPTQPRYCRWPWPGCRIPALNGRGCGQTRGESPIAALREEERKGHVGLAHYEMRKQGLVPTGNVMVTVAEDLWDVPGGRAVHATVDEDWCSLTRTCPVVASRQRLTAGKHLFRVQWKPRDQPTGFVSADGVLRVGFFADEIVPRPPHRGRLSCVSRSPALREETLLGDTLLETREWSSRYNRDMGRGNSREGGRVVGGTVQNVRGVPLSHPQPQPHPPPAPRPQEPAEAWDSDSMRGRTFYYRSAGNVYNGPCADPAVAAPAFQPGDTVHPPPPAPPPSPSLPY